MKAIILATFSLSLLILSGCTSHTVSKGKLYPAMYQEKPKTILVLPAVNHSSAADAPALYSSTVAQPLANAGFYVLSTEISNRFLKNEGITSGEQLSAVAPQKFASVFGADAVLYVTIDKWDTNYYILGGNVTVAMRYALKSTKTGNVLWSHSKELVLSTSSDNNQGSLLGALIATAIKTATQDYVPIARKANLIALNTIPFGEYHNQHGKDNTFLVEPAIEKNVEN